MIAHFFICCMNECLQLETLSCSLCEVYYHESALVDRRERERERIGVVFECLQRITLSCSLSQLYCHESALVGGEARVQAALIITNQDDQVVQVEESDVSICSRGNHLTMSVSVPNQDQCKNMAVLIKPLPK